jgi:L-lactate dehydrogenase complex protein LldG
MSTSRFRILDQVRASLAINRQHLLDQAAAYPAPHPRGPFMPSDLPVIEQFEKELSALHAYVHICDGPQAALDHVHALLEAANARRLIAWDSNELPLRGVADLLESLGIEQMDQEVLAAANRLSALRALEPAPVCISGVDAAIAESGSMIVVSGPGRGRLASLLPPLHIALLPADRIVRTLPDAFDLLRERYGDGLFRDHANVTIITGPSRTADIELSLTLGVHGPREIHAVVIR